MICTARSLHPITGRSVALPAQTLVLWGEQDTILERSNLELVTDSIDDVTVQFVDACGHQPHVEQPEAVVAALVQWCR